MILNHVAGLGRSGLRRGGGGVRVAIWVWGQLSQFSIVIQASGRGSGSGVGSAHPVLKVMKLQAAIQKYRFWFQKLKTLIIEFN